MCITGFVFWIFEKTSPELASKSTLYGYVMRTKGSIELRLRANCSPYSNDLYIFGKPNRPICTSQEAFCSFWPKSSKFTSRSRHPKQRNLLFVADLFTLQLCFLHFCIPLHVVGTREITYA